MTDQPTTPTDTAASAEADAAPARRTRRRAASRPAGPPAGAPEGGAEGIDMTARDATGAAPAAADAGSDVAAADAPAPAKKAARKRAPRKKAVATGTAETTATSPESAEQSGEPTKKATRKRTPRKKATPAQEPEAQPSGPAGEAAPVDASVLAPVDVAPAVPELPGTAPEPPAPEAAAAEAPAEEPASQETVVQGTPSEEPEEPSSQEPSSQEPSSQDAADAGAATHEVGAAEADRPASAPAPAPGAEPLGQLADLAATSATDDTPAATEEAATDQARIGEPAPGGTVRESAAQSAAQPPVSGAEPLGPLAELSDAPAAAEAPVIAAPAVPLLFQAPVPTTTTRRRRRASAPAGPPVHHDEPPTAEPGAQVEDRSAAPAEQPETAAQPTAEPTTEATTEPTTQRPSESVTEQPEEETTAGGRRRRRRGGRGRRTRAEEGEASADERADDETAAAETDDAADAADTAEVEPDVEGAAESAEAAEQDDEEGGAASRRRRRRRRRAGAGSAEEPTSEDPPGTVTKLRQPRRVSEGRVSEGRVSEGRDDEVASVKGSTRLEAKKQRRRDGREAGRRKPIITESEFLARRESVDRTMIVRERAGRTQIAVLEDDVLVEHYVANETNASMIGNVFLGRVQNVLPSMEAAFIDIGKGRNAVLYAGEVNWDAAGLEGGPRRIEAALKSGDSVLVQVTKDPMGHKGARLTSQVSLPGRYLVYVPNSTMTGISRKLPDTERSRLKKILKAVVPEDAGVIVRTAAEGASEDELQRDVERLAAQWADIQRRASSSSGGSAPKLLHGEPDLTVRVVRDVFNEDFSRLLVSGGPAWEVVQPYVSSVAPDLADRVSRWTSEDDVFAAHRVDEQLAKAMDRKVWLPSGGSLVIDRTEAMTVVDVNTGKFTGAGGNLEETVTRNNLEAAEEVVRQLRLRDIGGIIVVDFIDMVLESNRDLVLRRLVECLGRDRTKHQVAEVTSLGLVQMTRKRVGQGLLEVFSEPCEHCHGRGVVLQSEPVSRSGNGSGNGSGGAALAAGGTAAGGNGSGGKGVESGRSRSRGRGKSSSAPVVPPPPPRKSIPAGLVASLAHHSGPLAHPDDPDAAPSVADGPAPDAEATAADVPTDPSGELASADVARVEETAVEEVMIEEAAVEEAAVEEAAVEQPPVEQPHEELAVVGSRVDDLPASDDDSTGRPEPQAVHVEAVAVEHGQVEPAVDEPQPRRRRRRASAPSGPPPGAAAAALTGGEPAGDQADVEASPS